MSKVEMNAYEAVLRMCADAAPHAWHPQQYSRRSGTPMETVNGVLSELWQEGLLEKAPGHPDLGPGLRLSAKGWEVLNDPQALQRLREGVTVDAGERGEAARQALRPQRPPYVSRILVGMNVLVFLYGLYLANQEGVANGYLSGTGASDVLHKIGALTAFDWLHGERWRTLTACFVHIGGLHILMNMYMLYSAGQYIERIWGPVRFLVIYVLAGITGSMTGVAASPAGIAGASTALFGIFAAEAVWVLFNGKYLPKQVAREWRNHLFVNALLLVFISILPGISGWGHAGGAAAGAAAAVCLHYQRFGPPVWRWAALLGLLPIPLGGLYFIDYHRHHDEIWAKAELVDFQYEYKHDLEEPITKEMRMAFQDKVRPVLVDESASRREPAKVGAALTVLEEQRKQLATWQAQLNHLGPYVGKKAQEDRQKALDAVTARLDLYERMERCLKEGENFPANEDKALREQIAATPELQSRDERRLADVKKHEETDEERQAREKREREAEAQRKRQAEVAEEEAKFEKEHLQDISGKLKTAKTLFDDDLADYLDRPPSEWVAETLKKNTEKIEKSRKLLKTLMELLPTLGPYKSETIRTALERATACAPELATLLEMAQHRFEAGDKWTKDEQMALKKQEQKVDDLYKAWRSSLAK